MKGKYVPPFEALEKMRRYCSVQERSYKAVREKLYGFGLGKDQVENIIAELISDNYLNEQRFADAFASGRLRIKGWGRRKIEMGLRQLGVSAPCIEHALDSLNTNEYLEKLSQLASKRMSKETIGTPFEKQMKVSRFLVGRGYEPHLVRKVLDEATGPK